MIKHATTVTVIGFVLVFIGIVSLFLNLVGVDLIFLTWLYELGALVSLLVRLLMVIVGFVLIYVGQVDFRQEEI